MSPRRGGGCLGDALSGTPRRPVGRSSSAQPGAPQPCPAAAAAWRSRAPAAAPGASQPPPPPGTREEGGGRPPGKMKAEGGDHSMINLSVQQVLSLWAHGTVLRNLTGAAVAGIYRVAGKNMAPLEALVWGVGQTVLTLIISFSRILATL
ncbi:transmembrane protein 170B isoform 2-T2 [Molossus nigricans]